MRLTVLFLRMLTAAGLALCLTAPVQASQPPVAGKEYLVVKPPQPTDTGYSAMPEGRESGRKATCSCVHLTFPGDLFRRRRGGAV